MWLWGKNRELEEAARQERGKLAAEIVRNDRVNHRVHQKAKEDTVRTMLGELYLQLDGAKKRG